jgi:hypothetical protein
VSRIYRKAGECKLKFKGLTPYSGLLIKGGSDFSSSNRRELGICIYLLSSSGFLKISPCPFRRKIYLLSDFLLMSHDRRLPHIQSLVVLPCE